MSKEETGNVLDNATKHFKDQLANGMSSTEVPEWNTTIYFRTAFNFAQQEKIFELSNEGHMVSALVQTLIEKALNKDGKRLFNSASKQRLMHDVDPNVIIRVVSEINAELTEETIKKD